MTTLSADLFRTVLRSDALDVSSEAEALEVLIAWVRNMNETPNSTFLPHPSLDA